MSGVEAPRLRGVAVLLAAAATLVVLTATSAADVSHGLGANASGNAVQVSLGGAAGLQIGMTVEEARRSLPDRVPIVVTGGGSSRSLALPICKGRTEGVAEFSAQGGNGDGSYTYLKGDGFLLFVAFSAAAQTRAGVGIGSTYAEVARAYGKSLKSNSSGDLLLIGTPRRYAGRTATPTVAFVFIESKVVSLVYGTKDELEYASTDTASC